MEELNIRRTPRKPIGPPSPRLTNGRFRLAGVKRDLFNPGLPTLRQMERDDTMCRLADEHSRHTTHCTARQFREASDRPFRVPDKELHWFKINTGNEKPSQYNTIEELQGLTNPAMHTMWGRWAPVLERSRLVSFTYAGCQVGTVITLPVSGILSASQFGWPAVFYLFGALGCVWSVAWMLLVHSTPEEHPRISQEEKDYIRSSIGETKVLPTPWKSLLTSKAVWCLCAAHFANNWGTYTLLTCLPIYLKTILKFDVKENGYLSALPYLVMSIVQNIAGFMADYICSHGYLSTKNTRKLFSTIGVFLPTIFLIIAGYAGCDHTTVITFLTISVAVGGFVFGGYSANHLDIAPAHAGVLMGLTNTIATIPGMLAPAVVGWLTNNNQTMGQWQIIFYINAIICLVSVISYLICAEGEEQEWAKTHQVKKTADKNKNHDYSDSGHSYY